MFKAIATVAVILSALNTQAASYKVTIEKTFTKNDKVFQKLEPRADAYEMIDNHTVSDTKVRGQGIFSQLNSDKYGVIDREVIGQDVNGYAKMKIEHDRDDRVFIVMDGLIDDTIDGVQFRIPIKYSAPAKIIKGSWREFQKGEEITVRATNEGSRIMAEAVTAKVRFGMRQLKKSLAGSLGSGASIGDITVDELKILSRGTLKATQNRIEAKGSQLRFKLAFEIRL